MEARCKGGAPFLCYKQQFELCVLLVLDDMCRMGQ